MFTSIATSTPSNPESTPPFDPLATSFRPSIAVIIGVLTTMFSLTFLLLLYAKHCRRGDNSTTSLAALAAVSSPAASESGSNAPGATLVRRNSGVEPTLISLLPTFTFSSLQGLKEGLECAVCLSRFEPSDVLRLLPKCRHAFHLQCVDTWLDCHSTCPLCRCKVEAQDLPTDDPKLSSVSNGVLQCHPAFSDGTDSAVDLERSTGSQLIVQRENTFLDLIALQASNINHSCNTIDMPSNFNFARNTSLNSLDHPSTAQDVVDDLEQQRIQLSKRFWHRIIVSDAVFQHRWSDFKASDSLFITTQSLRMQLPAQCCNRETKLPCLPPEPANRISHSKSTKTKDNCSEASVDVSCSDVILRSAEYRRSMSEATGIRRFAESNSKSPATRPDEKTTRWFSIAKKTLNWLDRGAAQNGPICPNR